MKLSTIHLIIVLLTIGGMFGTALAEVTVEPLAIDLEFIDVEVEETVIRIGNEGQAPLEWHSIIESEGVPPHDPLDALDPGSLIKQFRGLNVANNYCSPIGWDWDNNRMWVTNTNRSLAASYSFETYDSLLEVERFNCGASADGAWAKGFLYLPLFDSTVLRRFDAEGQLIDGIEMPYRIRGLAADVENDWLFLLDGETNEIHVHPLSAEGIPGDQIGLIDNHMEFHNDTLAFGLEWVPENEDEGFLWMFAANNGRVYQISVDTDTWRCSGIVQNFDATPGRNNDDPKTSAAHDGHNLWVGAFRQSNIQIFADGIRDRYWITMEPRSGEVDSGDEVESVLTCDMTGMLEGDYQAEIHILSNDENNPDVAIEVMAHVTGAADINVVWSVDFGYPDLINFNEAFPEVFVSQPYRLPFTIENRGTADLALDSIESNNEAFSSPGEPLVLPPGERIEREVVFLAPEAGMHEGALTFFTNDPDMQEFDVMVRAEAVNPPVINVNPLEIELQSEADTLTSSISISNDGDATLRWSASIGGIVRDGSDDTEIGVVPSEGEIPSGNDVDVELTFRETAHLDEAETYFLFIDSNDPTQPQVTIQIVLNWLSVDQNRETLPTELTLNSLYPNPFNPSSTLEFGLPTPSRVEAGIYSLNGQLVTALANGNWQAGMHRVAFDAGTIPAGVYLLKLEAVGKVRTAKAVVVR